MQPYVISDCSSEADIQSVVVYYYLRIQNQIVLKRGRVLIMVSTIIQDILKSCAAPKHFAHFGIKQKNLFFGDQLFEIYNFASKRIKRFLFYILCCSHTVCGSIALYPFSKNASR